MNDSAGFLGTLPALEAGGAFVLDISSSISCDHIAVPLHNHQCGNAWDIVALADNPVLEDKDTVIIMSYYILYLKQTKRNKRSFRCVLPLVASVWWDGHTLSSYEFASHHGPTFKWQTDQTFILMDHFKM